MLFHLKEGRLHLRARAADVHLRGLRPSLVYWTGGTRHAWRPTLQPAPGGGTATDAERGLALEWHAAAEGDALSVHVTLRNTGTAPLRVQSLAPLWLPPQGRCAVGPSAADWGVLRNGYQSWTGTRSFRSGDTDLDPWSDLLKVGLIDVRHPSAQAPGRFRSDLFTAIGNLRSRDALVLGFLDGAQACAGIDVGIEQGECTHLAAELDYDEVELAPGATLAAPPLWLAAGNDGGALLEAYADASGQAMRARVPAHNPKGWCSWYYYFTAIDQACIRDNLAALGRLGERFGCDYVQVDDGYQSAIGDWLTPNPRFPDGMGAIASEIRAAGKEAGLWTAPFVARNNSRLFRDHPDWFVRDERGGPRFALWNPMWGLGACYALDTTHPAVLDWLRQTFRTIVHDWGYRVLKLDFLYAAALPGQRHDPGVTRAQALRRGLDAIREAAGDDAFLLGCGCPLGPAVGVVDAMRIGPDVAPFWDNFMTRGPQRDQHGVATRHAVRNTLTRAFLHRRWWLNDPDCLMVRDTRTNLTAEEVRSLATAIAVTDGMLIVSDNLRELSAASVEVLQRTLDLWGGTASVPDLLAADPPEVVVNASPGRIVVAVFNFADTPRERSVDLAALGLAPLPGPVREFWTGAPVAVEGGVARLGSVPPHGCRVIVHPLQPAP